jgi:hypothetical protein
MPNYTASGFLYADELDRRIDWPDDSQILADKLESVLGGTANNWLTYTPTISGGWTGIGVTFSAQYATIGKTVHLRIRFLLSSSLNAGTNLLLSLPVTASANTFNQGLALLSVGGTNNQGVVRNENTTTARVIAQTANGPYVTVTQLTSSVPGSWAANDTVTFSLTYQAA